MADDTAIVSSGADLASMAPADIFSGIDDSSADATVETAAPAEETIETPESMEEAPVETEPEEPETEEPEPETEEQPAQPEKKEGQPEELPEGVVRGKDRNGKPGL